jgi:outer membrane protein OmpA-like peptidoglycan-associated protein
MRHTLRIIAVSLATLLPAASLAQQNAKDHPLVSRFQGSTVLEYKVADFDEFPLALGPIESGTAWAKSERLEGRVTKFKYSTPADRSTLEIMRTYRNALQSAGFEILYACDGQACFSDKFRGGYTGSASGIWCTNCEEPMRYVAAKLARPAGDAYVSLVVEKDKYEGGTWLSIVEVKPMGGGLVKVNAQAMGNDIAASGHVALYGIYFDTGKAILKPESKAALDEIAKLLTAQPSLRLHVVGHTDNVGALASNMALSKQRAESVVHALTTDYKIAGGRLIGNGVGPLAPVASNAAEEGRAKNRRVELVAQ